MDLRPENILYDGHCIQLTGWMAAFMNDRYFDLAAVANYLANNEKDETALLTGYFGCEPDEQARARFFLMRQAVHMLAACIYMTLGAAGQPISPPEDVPAFADFGRRLWNGDAHIEGNAGKLLYGWLHWRELIQNTQTRRFKEALAVVEQHSQAGERLLLPQYSI